jgi:aldose 1-epimerase
LRAYTVDGIDIVDGYSRTERSPCGRGQVLAPWPNRLCDGRYAFEDRQAQAALDEVPSSTAIHGLVRWLPWQVSSLSADEVVLGCVLHPQPAYPWRLGLRVEYRLESSGLTVTAEARNLDEVVLPFGIGFHPYFTVGTPRVDAASVLIPAGRRLQTNERGLPTGEVDVAGTPFDFRASRPLGPINLDTGYTSLIRGQDGRACARLDDPAGRRTITLWVDHSFKYLMVFTGDTVEPPDRRRASVALEPMTCPPNALASGTDLVRLDPDESWRGSWGIKAN